MAIVGHAKVSRCRHSFGLTHTASGHHPLRPQAAYLKADEQLLTLKICQPTPEPVVPLGVYHKSLLHQSVTSGILL